MLGIARGDVDLGAQAVLALAHDLGDVRRQRLGLERLVQNDRLDRFVDGLLEARHVRALLARVQIDEAFDLRVEQLRVVPSALIRTTFSTPVSPTRERLMCVVGRRAWTSSRT